MVRRLVPEDLVGHFFAVGSVSETDPQLPADYVSTLSLPYWYQLPALREEDMVRQFAYMIDGFEEEEDFVLDLDMFVYRDIVETEEPILIDEEHAHGLYILAEKGPFRFFKTQQTAPATMCFTVRGPDGKQLISAAMLRFFSSLMRRIAEGQVRFLREFCDTIMLCQDDPALGFVIKMAERDSSTGLTGAQIVRETESVFPAGAIPAYHYCEDWRSLRNDEEHLLWDTKTKIVHIDVVRYPPEIDEEQAERMNRFMERGGGLALGVLPNVDDGYSRPVIETLTENLHRVLALLGNRGVDISLLATNAMISTQCGLSRATPELVRQIHARSVEFPIAFERAVKRTT
ncbi:MAG TPA: hypothetical protein ENG31_00825 [Candidatus Thorarchaeota archaeon]|nr:hypothetical protein [Candidatus Thorarchaeota archaeon]